MYYMHEEFQQAAEDKLNIKLLIQFSNGKSLVPLVQQLYKN